MNTSADEQAIRNIVAEINEGKPAPYTPSNIFVSGAFARPIIGEAMSPEDKTARERMQKERLNYKSNSRIQRLEVAQAGDMAYEFGYADLSWDTPENKQVRFESSYLRVWRKVGGEWKVAVFFARPNTSTQPK